MVLTNSNKEDLEEKCQFVEEGVEFLKSLCKHDFKKGDLTKQLKRIKRQIYCGAQIQFQNTQATLKHATATIEGFNEETQKWVVSDSKGRKKQFLATQLKLKNSLCTLNESLQATNWWIKPGVEVKFTNVQGHAAGQHNSKNGTVCEKDSKKLGHWIVRFRNNASQELSVDSKKLVPLIPGQTAFGKTALPDTPTPTWLKERGKAYIMNNKVGVPPGPVTVIKITGPDAHVRSDHNQNEWIVWTKLLVNEQPPQDGQPPANDEPPQNDENDGMAGHRAEHHVPEQGAPPMQFDNAERGFEQTHHQMDVNPNDLSYRQPGSVGHVEMSHQPRGSIHGNGNQFASVPSLASERSRRSSPPYQHGGINGFERRRMYEYLKKHEENKRRYRRRRLYQIRRRRREREWARRAERTPLIQRLMGEPRD